ncbi:MAG TPA: hypothetical protein VMV25_13315 [Steroidobacteraceae bacterium]|nr:hypothetical protein [Steroidobacteraceae bacterium]
MNNPLGTYRPVCSAAVTALIALLTACGGYGSHGMNPPTNVTISGAILPTLKTMSTIGSTLDPTEHGGNPYGLTVATATSGLITMGDLIICNFNDGATNTQGMGTTVVGLHPTAGAMPYRIAQSAQLLGCSSLTSLADGSIIAADSQANTVDLIAPNGTPSAPFSADAFAEPWSVIAATHASNDFLYVSDANTGAIDRIALTNDAQTSFTEIAAGFSTNHGVPGSISAPAGLTYDATSDTLYVVDTNANRVVALANVSAIGTDGVIVSGTNFSGASAASAKVIATGAPLNGPISGALLVNGDLVVGNTLDPNGTNLLIEISPTAGVVASANVDTGAGGAIFGISTVPTTITTMGSYGSTNTLTDVIYFNDDNDNTVKLLAQ